MRTLTEIEQDIIDETSKHAVITPKLDRLLDERAEAERAQAPAINAPAIAAATA